MTSTSTPSKPFDIAVVGGGIGGVVLAIGLLHNHIPFTLYESAHAFGEIGAGVSFGPNAVWAMRLIDPAIEEAFHRVATRNSWESKKDLWFTFRYGQDKNDGSNHVGDVITDLASPPVGQCGVYRASYLEELVKLLPEGVAHFSKRLEEIEDNGDYVTLHFHDGTAAKHSAIVGCDGIKSRTRQIVLGKESPVSHPQYTHTYAYRGLIPMGEAVQVLGEEEARNSQQYLGYDGHLLTFPIQKGRTMNVVAFRTRFDHEWKDDRWVVPMNREDMDHDFENFGDSVKKILSMMQKPDVWALFHHLPAPTYYKGRICLLGDAAHATTPHCGAGAGQAIEDAYVLSNILAKVTDVRDLETAFSVYDEVRRPRSQRLVSCSRETGKLYDFELEETQDDKESLKRNLGSRFRWLWEEDVERHGAGAVEKFEQLKSERRK
ncbi:FAD/NAD(P)-binding domain-containing protein [Viridothelium virens]|uniref:FAD/NAD(P)-binding domain-containing protein n=1 Tax=Viridothelium virens TaxID=1048519 RepID=A0A6A6HI64_VIRVR|nr:FAD/NAD(P)-binding domain-containing protein [Viridothelium virens]